MRYVVTEIEGYAIVLPLATRHSETSLKPGLSVQVIDTADNHRVVFSARTEEHSRGRSRLIAAELIRDQAATRCDLLNRLDEIAREAQGAVA